MGPEMGNVSPSNWLDLSLFILLGFLLLFLCARRKPSLAPVFFCPWPCSFSTLRLEVHLTVFLGCPYKQRRAKSYGFEVLAKFRGIISWLSMQTYFFHRGWSGLLILVCSHPSSTMTLTLSSTSAFVDQSHMRPWPWCLRPLVVMSSWRS